MPQLQILMGLAKVWEVQEGGEQVTAGCRWAWARSCPDVLRGQARD